MMLRRLFLAIIPLLLLIPTSTVFASEEKPEPEPEQTQTYVGGDSKWYREDGYPRNTENRPAINPDFAPDRSCDLKWELKCIPGSEQQCSDLRGYDNGEMNVCTPIGCPDGYHGNFEWEDNVCYSNEIDCQDDWVLVEGAYGTSCEPLYNIEEGEEIINSAS
jgi:hypothetical protein